MASAYEPWVILLTGTDRANIVAQLCDGLESLQCRLADAQIGRLAGRFSGVIVTEAPPGTTAAQLSAALDPLRLEGVRVQIDRADRADLRRHSQGASAYMISYTGADRAGLLGALSHALADMATEFVSVDVDVRREGDEDVYVLVCEADLPDAVSEEALRQTCDRIGEQFGADLVVLPSDLDSLVAE